MNKPATKEPSMDEILSSIRQIIADDDAATATVKPVVLAPVEPLALSAAQMLPTARHIEGEPMRPIAAAVVDFPAAREEFTSSAEPYPTEETHLGEAQLVDTDDVAFESDPEPATVNAPAPQARQQFEARPASRPAASVARAAPMPDPQLSADLAEQLLAPATDAAVQSAISRLGAVAGGGPGGMTVEAMIRDMLRPMLKDWLDENLPSLVERMVEKEIGRISRGVK